MDFVKPCNDHHVHMVNEKGGASTSDLSLVQLQHQQWCRDFGKWQYSRPDTSTLINLARIHKAAQTQRSIFFDLLFVLTWPSVSTNAVELESIT